MSLQTFRAKKSFFRGRYLKSQRKITKRKVLKQKKKKIRKRFEKRPKIQKCENVKIFGINSAGIKSKIHSFNDVLDRVKPLIWMLQETKLKPGDGQGDEPT